MCFILSAAPPRASPSTLVKIIDEGDKSVGQYTSVWDGKNDDGEKVSSGVYFYQLRAKVNGQSDYNKTMKMVIVR